MNKLIALFMLAISVTAHAGLTLTLTPSVQSSARGAEIVFRGTLTNASSTDKLYLNDISFTLSGASATHLTPSTNAFFANVPGILSPGESYTTDEIFHITLSATAPFGTYPASVTINGGDSLTASNALATSSFTVIAPNPANDSNDLDHDGIPDLLEYALNLNPSQADQSALPTSVVTNDHLTLSLKPNPAATDLTFAIQASTDLINWSTTAVEEVTPLSDLATGKHTFRFSQPLSTTPRGFLRVSVTRN